MEFRRACYTAEAEGTNTKVHLIPSFVKGLSGFDTSTGRIYGYTTDTNVLIWTENGVNWTMFNTAETLPTFATLPVVIPANAASDFNTITFGTWTGNN